MMPPIRESSGDQGLTSAPQRWHDSWLWPTFLAATRLENPGSLSQAIVNKYKRGFLSNDWSCLTFSTCLSLCCSPTPINGPWILAVCWFLSTRERDPLGVSMVSIRLMCPALTPIFTWLLFPPGHTAWTSRPHLVLSTLASQPTLTSTTVSPYRDLRSFYNWPREGSSLLFLSSAYTWSSACPQLLQEKDRRNTGTRAVTLTPPRQWNNVLPSSTSD